MANPVERSFHTLRGNWRKNFAPTAYRSHFRKSTDNHEYSPEEVERNAKYALEADQLMTVAQRILNRVTDYETFKSGSYPPVTYFENELPQLIDQLCQTDSPLQSFNKDELNNIIPALKILAERGDVAALNKTQRKAIAIGQEVAAAMINEKKRDIEELYMDDSENPPVRKTKLNTRERDWEDRYHFAEKAYGYIREDFLQITQQISRNRSSGRTSR